MASSGVLGEMAVARKQQAVQGGAAEPPSQQPGSGCSEAVNARDYWLNRPLSEYQISENMSQEQRGQLSAELGLASLVYLQSIQRSVHFLEKRQDASCSLPSDCSRHEAQFENAIKEAKSIADKEEVNEEMRWYKMDKAAMRRRGTCWAWLMA